MMFPWIVLLRYYNALGIYIPDLPKLLNIFSCLFYIFHGTSLLLAFIVFHSNYRNIFQIAPLHLVLPCTDIFSTLPLEWCF